MEEKTFSGLKDYCLDSHLDFPSTSRQQEELRLKEILVSRKGKKGFD